MVKTRHGGGETNEADEDVDIEMHHCSSQSKPESLETKESFVNVSVYCYLHVMMSHVLRVFSHLLGFWRKFS